MRKSISKLMRPDPRRCEAARSVMSDYLDGDLDAAARKKLERHVRFCARCHTVLGNLRETLARLRGLELAERESADGDAALACIGSGWRGSIERNPRETSQ